MAIDLKKLKKEKDHPPRICLHGSMGCGKSMTATCAPVPMWLNLEKSVLARDLGIGNQTPSSYPEVMEYLTALLTQEHEFKSIIIDTLDRLEKMITDYVCEVNGYENISKTPWGEGLTARTKEWLKFFNLLDRLNTEKGMIVIVVCHSVIVDIEDPVLPKYGKHTLNLYKRDAPYVTGWVDLVGYCMIKTFTTTDGERNLAITDNEHIICCQPKPAYDAKTRYEDIPDEIPMDWGILLKYICASCAPVKKSKKKTTENKEE